MRPVHRPLEVRVWVAGSGDKGTRTHALIGDTQLARSLGWRLCGVEFSLLIVPLLAGAGQERRLKLANYNDRATAAKTPRYGGVIEPIA